MKFHPVVHPGAKKELQEIVTYLNNQRSGLGDQFVDELEQTIRFLQEFAPASRLRRNKYRNVLIGRFKILMVYHIKGSDAHIKRVIHAARRESSRYQK